MESIYFENSDGLYYRKDVPENTYGIKICDIVDAYRVVGWYNKRMAGTLR